MARREAGAVKVLRGLGIALASVVILVLIAVFWRQAVDGVVALWEYFLARIPSQGGQKTAVLIYMIAAALLGILFSQAGQSEAPETTTVRFAMLMRAICERNGGAFVGLNSLEP